MPPTRTPTILLLFANDRVGAAQYLRDLPRERRRLLRALKPAGRAYRIIAEPNITRARLFDLLREHGPHTVGVHFGGHAHPDGLFIEEEGGRPIELNIAGLAGRLGDMPNLRWVCLNGCATQAQVAVIHQRARATVIATDRAIDDAAAVEFAEELYASLAAARSLGEGFAAARDRLSSWPGGGSQRLLRPGAVAPDAGPPWRLVDHPETSDGHRWRLMPGGAMASAQPTHAMRRPPAERIAPGPTTDDGLEVLTAWLHLSDIHHGHGDARHRADQGLVLDALYAELARAPALGVPAIDRVLVTGDIAFSGAGRSADEYVQAAASLERIGAVVDVPSEGIYCVPGNHDVNRNAGGPFAGPVLAMYRGGAPIDTALVDAAQRQVLEDRKRAYLDFTAAYAPEGRGRLWWHAIHAMGDGMLRLVGLDTALLSHDDTDHGRLWLGKTPLNETLTDVGERELVVVLTHHPVTGGWLGDQQFVGRKLRRACHIHLSGHVHDPASEDSRAGGGRRHIRVAGGAAHGETDAGHGFNYAAILRDGEGALFLRVWPRRWSVKKHDFVVDGDLVDGDRDVFTTHPLDVRWPRSEDSTEDSADGIGDDSDAIGEPIESSLMPSESFVAVADPMLGAWRTHLRARHGRLVTLFPEVGDSPLDDVYVELAIDRGMPSDAIRDATRDATRDDMTLAALMVYGSRPGRWAVLGEPGAGKSTLARRLARRSADDPDGPIVVYLPLVEWRAGHQGPFEAAAARLSACPSLGGRALDCGGLALALKAAVDAGRSLWLLLDGFDELDVDSVRRLRPAISTFAESHPTVAIAVLSRQIGYQRLRGFEPVGVRRLDATRQRALLGQWLGDEAGAGVHARIQARPDLRLAAGNPLLLSLMAMLARGNDNTLPDTRGELYDRALDLLLRRGHTDQQRGLEKYERRPARRILAALALDLVGTGAELWSVDDLDDRLMALAEGETVGRLIRRFGDESRFLHRVVDRTGILGPDMADGRWRFLHRSLGERLAADALAAAGADAIVERLRGMAGDDEQLGRWGETLGMAIGLLPDPSAALAKLREVDAKLTLRVLPELTGLPPGLALETLFTIDCGEGDLWDGDLMLRLAEAWSDAERHLWAWVASERTLDELAFLHFALESVVGEPPDRPGFFARAGRPIDPAIEPELCPVPGGELMMGSPPDEPERLAIERQHRVRVSTFELAPTPVTVSEYRRFHWGHVCLGADDHPVTVVGWWRSRLYAAWVGCRLPTEAEWEYACRAGTTTRYWSGDAETDLGRVAWYASNSADRTHPVAEKPANPLGLYDMHGNVSEWCADGFSVYPIPSSMLALDPVVFPVGLKRVVRGGSWWSPSAGARSACRSLRPPSFRDHGDGFRLARRSI